MGLLIVLANAVSIAATVAFLWKKLRRTWVPYWLFGAWIGGSSVSLILNVAQDEPFWAGVNTINLLCALLTLAIHEHSKRYVR